MRKSVAVLTVLLLASCARPGVYEPTVNKASLDPVKFEHDREECGAKYLQAKKYAEGGTLSPILKDTGWGWFARQVNDDPKQVYDRCLQAKGYTVLSASQ